MERRVAGLVVLLLAVVALISVPRLLNPGIPGQASAAPLPEPPPIGTCVDLEARSWLIVDCTQPHDGEIFAGWLATDPARPRPGNRSACDSAVGLFLASRLPGEMYGWSVTVLNVDTRVVSAPRSQRAGRVGWSACALLPANHASYVGNLDGADGRRPGVFGSCAADDRITQVPCTAPHTVEQLAAIAGIRQAVNAEQLDANGLPATLTAELNKQCFLIAQKLTGNPDPTYASLLSVDVESAGFSAANSDSFGTGYRSFDATCSLTSQRQPLIDSVVGLGISPLPVA